MTIFLAVLECQLWEQCCLMQEKEGNTPFSLVLVHMDDRINECRAGNVDVVFKDVSVTN